MNRNLLNTLSNIYYECLPRGVRKIMRPLVEPTYAILRRIYSIISDFYPVVTIFKANGNSNSPNLTLLIAGRGDVSPFFLDRICNVEPRTTTHSRRVIWTVPSIDRSQVNAIMIEADRCFSRFLSQRGFIAIPEWVLFTMDVSIPVEEIFRRLKKSKSNDLRKIRKHQYVCEVGSDRNKLHLFYHKMYLPYIVARYGKLALLASFGYIKNLLQKGGLLLVKKGREYVSGILISTATSIPMVALLGVKDGRRDYVKQGAISALYYYTILWAKGRGYTDLDFGHCRPILNDGVFVYKKRFGMGIRRSSRKHRTLYLSIGRPNLYLRQFFINNPLVYDDRGELKGFLFFPNNDQPTRQEIEALKKKYFIPGLEGFKVILLDSPNSNL